MTEDHRHPISSLRMLDEDDAVNWQHTRPRAISPEDWHRYEASIAEILAAMGMELGTAGTERTPATFLRALFDATEGYEGDPKLVTAFPTECRGGSDCELSQVIEGPIPYHALCALQRTCVGVQPMDELLKSRPIWLINVVLAGFEPGRHDCSRVQLRRRRPRLGVLAES